MAFSNKSVKIEAQTWVKGSCELFDYESGSYNAQTFDVSHSGKLDRDTTHVEYSITNRTTQKLDNLNEDKEDSAMVYMQEARGGIKIVPRTLDPEDSNALWQVIPRNKPTFGHKLGIGDVVKMGKTYFRVLKIKSKDQKIPQPYKGSVVNSIKEYMMDQERRRVSIVDSSKLSTCEYTCKICLYTESDLEDDPLISPCTCTGSIKYVHLKCLQKWICSKLNVHQDNNIMTVICKELDCELCKTKIPLYFKQNEETLDLIPLQDKASDSYVILESFSKSAQLKNLHVFDFSQHSTFRIGRGRDSDLKVPDISVSRVQAFFSLVRGQFYVSDNHSKFGTLVLIKEPILINEDNSKSPLLQCGRSTFKMSLKRSWMWFLPCMNQGIQQSERAQSSNYTFIEFGDTQEKVKQQDIDV